MTGRKVSEVFDFRPEWMEKNYAKTVSDLVSIAVESTTDHGPPESGAAAYLLLAAASTLMARAKAYQMDLNETVPFYDDEIAKTVLIEMQIHYDLYMNQLKKNKS